MNRIIIALLVLSVLTSCGPKPQPGREVAPQVTVSDIAAETNNHEMTVLWKKHGNALISGYNIYITDKALGQRSGAVAPFNTTPFPGDTDPDDGIEHFVANGLENGVEYYVWVKVLFPDGSESAPTGEAVAMCGPKGEIELSIRNKGDHDGFSFEKNEYVDAYSVDNDFYFFALDGTDYLGSPSRLDGFINHTQLIVVKSGGDYAALAKQLMTSKIVPTEDRIAVKTGNWVLARTQRETFAVMHVESFSGEGENRRIKLRYAYHVIVGDSQT